MENWEITGVVVAALTGIGGLITGVAGFVRASKANELAQKANDIAEDANRKADAANRIAADANEISGDANAISKSALAVTQDEVVYDWKFKLDKKTLVVVAHNDCAHDALNVRAVIRKGDETISESTVDHVAAFEKFTLEGDSLVDQVRHSQAGIDRINSQQGMVYVGRGSTSAVIHIAWNTAQGVPRSEVIKKKFS